MIYLENYPQFDYLTNEQKCQLESILEQQREIFHHPMWMKHEQLLVEAQRTFAQILARMSRSQDANNYIEDLHEVNRKIRERSNSLLGLHQKLDLLVAQMNQILTGENS
jgi:hypothetical protein